MSDSACIAAIVVHGGAGASVEDQDGCHAAARAGLATFAGGSNALDAVVAAVVALEDDGRFNAGSGSELALDGHSIEMDAAVMDTRGTFGAVAGIKAVKNPILVARAVAGTPHCMLVGDGLQHFARKMGFADYAHVSDKARRHHTELLAKLQSAQQAMPGVDNNDFARFWNYDALPAFRHRQACDTVGAVARDARGQFAVAGSTGGSTPSLLGRVGDTVMVGSGFYAGPLGAIAATGVGEHIIRHLLAREVYQWLAEGMPLERALERGVGLFDSNVDVGLIGITANAAHAHSNRDMPSAVMTCGQEAS